jgi:ABC-type nickel/cobalt efflux system permease component RcnA
MGNLVSPALVRSGRQAGGINMTTISRNQRTGDLFSSRWSANRRKAMKLFTASIVAIAVVASPVFAQDTNNTAPTTTATSTKTTTRHIHATNVPMRHKATKRHHHSMRCGCPATNYKHHARRHHVKKTTTTTTKS